MENPSVSFPKPESVGPREWGHEVLLGHIPKQVIQKLIVMKAGKRGGRQRHHLKAEIGTVTAGQLKVYLDSGRLDEKGNKIEHTRVCFVGDTFEIPPGADHQIEAITDCAYIEASTPHFNDRIHVEHEYGIDEEDGGLPSTKLEDVECR